MSVWICAMRPFFLLSILSAGGGVAWWMLVLLGWVPAPPVAGGALIWHTHELILGLGLAAVAGFALTALPEFTSVPCATTGQLQTLVVLWLGARLGFSLSGADWLSTPALVGAALAQGGLALGLVAVLAPALRTPQGRHHTWFGGLILALAATSTGFYVDVLGEYGPGLRWLYASLGILMLLIVVAASRISMRVVNAAVSQVTPHAPPYLARPPRRHLAALCIALYTTVEFFQPATALAGWLALAAAAAVLNLLNDWHIGAALWRRRSPLLLYLMYWCMALGYLGLGLGALQWIDSSTAGRHGLGMGAMGLGIFVVIAIAGRAHVGLPPDSGPWLAWGAAALCMATGVRAVVALAGLGTAWLALAALLWCLAFALLLWRVGPGLWRPRSDGRSGCAG